MSVPRPRIVLRRLRARWLGRRTPRPLGYDAGHYASHVVVVAAQVVAGTFHPAHYGCHWHNSQMFTQRGRGRKLVSCAAYKQRWHAHLRQMRDTQLCRLLGRMQRITDTDQAANL